MISDVITLGSARLQCSLDKDSEEGPIPPWGSTLVGGRLLADVIGWRSEPRTNLELPMAQTRAVDVYMGSVQARGTEWGVLCTVRSVAGTQGSKGDITTGHRQ